MTDRAALFAEAYQRQVMPVRVQGLYEEAARRGVVQDPFAASAHDRRQSGGGAQLDPLAGTFVPPGAEPRSFQDVSAQGAPGQATPLEAAPNAPMVPLSAPEPAQAPVSAAMAPALPPTAPSVSQAPPAAPSGPNLPMLRNRAPLGTPTTPDLPMIRGPSPSEPVSQLPELPLTAARGFPVAQVGPVTLETAMQAADTPQGQINILRQRFPQAQLVADEVGNPNVAVVLGANDQGLPPEQAFLLNKPGMSLQDLNRFEVAAGQAALPTAASIVAAPLNALGGGAVTGAAAGASEVLRQGVSRAAGSGEGSDWGSVALSTLFGVGGELTGRGVGVAFDAVKRPAAQAIARLLGRREVSPNAVFDAEGRLSEGAIKALQDAGYQPDDVTRAMGEAVERLEQQGARPGEGLVRAAEFEAAGVSPTRAQVSGDRVAIEREIEAAKRPGGEALVERLEQQPQQIAESLGRMQTRTGGEAGSRFEAGEAVESRLREQLQAAEGEVKKLYQAADAAAPQGPAVRVNGVFKALGASQRSFARTEAAAIRTYMKEQGITDASKLTGQQAEQLRQFVTQAMDTGDRRVLRYLHSVRDALDNAVGETAYGSARLARRKLGETFERQKLVNDLLNQRLAPEQLFDKVVGRGGKVRDVIALRDTLGADSQAWNDVRGQVFAHLSEKAVSAQGRLNAATFMRELKRIPPEKQRILFSTEERRALITLQRVMQRINQYPANVSGSAAAALNTMAGRTAAIAADLVSLGAGAPPVFTALRVVRDQLAKRGARNAVLKPLDDVLRASSARSLDEPLSVRDVTSSGIQTEQQRRARERRKRLANEQAALPPPGPGSTPNPARPATAAR